MTKNQTLAACVKLAPDFTLRFERRLGQDLIVASCTICGSVQELSMAIAGWPRARIETKVLESALASLRKRLDPSQHSPSPR